MDEEFEIEFTPDTDSEDEDDFVVVWKPETNEQALRWECVIEALKHTSNTDNAVKLANQIFNFVAKGKAGPVGVIKDKE